MAEEAGVEPARDDQVPVTFLKRTPTYPSEALFRCYAD